jgi:hypothetical protein
MIYTRTFHNPLTQESFEVTSDEQYLPSLRDRIVKEVEGADPDWLDESKYVHQDALDYRVTGLHPKIVLKKVPVAHKDDPNHRPGV